jgi:uncharacterized repeat protein (TIGR03803 family)
MDVFSWLPSTIFEQNSKEIQMNFTSFQSGSPHMALKTGCSQMTRILHQAGARPSGVLARLFRSVIIRVAIFALVMAATTTQGQTFSVLYNFGTNSGDGENPANPGIVAQGRDGNMYSTTVNGGANGVGTVFKITPAGKITVIYSFNQAQGYAPYSGLTLGTDGNLYGTTAYGGSGGFGTVFKITPGGSFKVLYNFTGGTDGLYPMAPPIQGTDGNWYGTTQGDFHNNGSLYRLSPSGKFKALYTFVGIQGSQQPKAPLLQATDGNFYGTTALGPVNNEGNIFRVSRSGKLTDLYNFDSTHGAMPFSPLVQGNDGNFYGTTTTGGQAGGGVGFKVTPTGELTVLYDLGNVSGPSNPYGGLVQAADGYFYGTTYQGGTMSDGAIFRINAKGQFSDLYDFDVTTGLHPEDTLLQHTNGILYGETYQGGTSVPACGNSGCGVFFSWNASLKPFVSLVSAFGKVGKTIEILGQGFKGTTGVSVNGFAAKFTVVTDTYLTAVVPNGATTGSVIVKTPSGTLTSNKPFRVTPVILSFSPTSGKVGIPVTITGDSLTQATKVTFGGVKATSFTVNSDTRVTATVPNGAKTGKIAITTPGGTATSSGMFTVE